MAEDTEGNEALEFGDFSGILRDFADQKLVVNRIQGATRSSGVVGTDPNNWISKTRRNDDGSFEILIGEKKIPAGTLGRWKWGAQTVEAQFVVKVAHEYAHIVQHKFDSELLSYLDSRDDSTPVPNNAYIRLYLAVEEFGRLTGLSSEGVYHAQSAHTGNLHMPIYEDMAELIGARMLGKNYFDFRMRHAAVQLPDDVATSIGALIDAILEDYLR